MSMTAKPHTLTARTRTREERKGKPRKRKEGEKNRMVLNASLAGERAGGQRRAER